MADPVFATLGLHGSSSGTITLKPQAAAGTYNFNYPTTAGTTGQVLTSAGGVGAPMTWSTPGSGTVTSVGGTGTVSGLTLTGTVTTSGNLTLGGTLSAPFSAITGTATYAQLPTEVQQLPLAFVLPGKPTTGAVFNISVPIAVTIPASLAGATVYDTTLATGSAVFTVNKITTGNTITALGTVTITTTNHFSCTLAGAGGSLAAGDVLQLVAPTQDSTLSDVGITILASRV